MPEHPSWLRPANTPRREVGHEDVLLEPGETALLCREGRFGSLLVTYTNDTLFGHRPLHRIHGRLWFGRRGFREPCLASDAWADHLGYSKDVEKTLVEKVVDNLIRGVVKDAMKDLKEEPVHA